MPINPVSAMKLLPELFMYYDLSVTVSVNKNITISNLYIPPRDAVSTQYATLETYIIYCIQYITDTLNSILSQKAKCISMQVVA